MSKKILLLVFFALLIVILAVKIKANTGSTGHYFIGVTIAQGTSAPGCNFSEGSCLDTSPVDSNWCLPSGSTLTVQKVVQNSSNQNLPVCSTIVTSDCYFDSTTNPIVITQPGCAGITIWSGLLNLTSGTEYNINIIADASENDLDGFYAYCPGAIDYNYGWIDCWVSLGVNKSCADTCSYYNLTLSKVLKDNIFNYQNDCGFESFLMGKPCSSCTLTNTYSYYDPDPSSVTAYQCWYSQNWDNVDDTGAAVEGIARACPCVIPFNTTGSSPNFNFSLTPNF